MQSICSTCNSTPLVVYPSEIDSLHIGVLIHLDSITIPVLVSIIDPDAVIAATQERFPPTGPCLIRFTQ